MKSLTIALNKQKTEWQLQEAKAMFSEVVKSAVSQPQIITVRGKKTAVVLSFEDYQRLSIPKSNLYEFIQNSPLRDLQLELPAREIEAPREVYL